MASNVQFTQVQHVVLGTGAPPPHICRRHDITCMACRKSHTTFDCEPYKGYSLDMYGRPICNTCINPIQVITPIRVVVPVPTIVRGRAVYFN
jgi:hypothetical protein